MAASTSSKPVLWKMTWPIFIELLLQMLVGNIDQIMLSHFNATAVAAVGNANQVITILLLTFSVISLASTILISQYLGAGQQEKVQQVYVLSAVVNLAVSLVLMALLLLGADRLMALMQVPAEARAEAAVYLRITAVSLPFQALMLTFSAFLRAHARMTVIMLSTGVINLVNILGNTALIYGLGPLPQLGAAGAALSTLTCRMVGMCLLLVSFLRSIPGATLSPRMLNPWPSMLFRRLLGIGLPAGVQSSLFAVSNIVIQSAINSLGTVVMAASSAAFNIEILTFDIIDAFSQACTTFVGQNYGAGKIDRCKKTLKLCMLEGLIALVTAIAILLFFGKPLLSIFNNDPEVVETGYIRMMYVMFSHVFNLLYNVMSGYLRGFSISLTPAILTMLGVCGVRIAWIRYVFPLSATFKTIMIAYPVSLGITALMIFAALLCYRPSKRFAGTRDEV